MKLTVDDLALAITRLDSENVFPVIMPKGLAAELLPFINRHIAGQQGEEDVELLMQSIKPATVYGDGSRDWIVTGSHLRELARRLTAPIHQPAKTYRFDKILDELGPEHRAKVEKRFQELLADYNSQEPVSIPQPSKPAGAVPMPELAIVDSQCECHPETCGHWPYDLKLGELKIRNGDLNACSATKDAIIAYGNAREAAAGGVPEAWRAFVEECSRTAGGEVCGNRLSMRAKSLLDAIPQQPTAEGAVEGATHWEENASYLLDRCKHSIRVREGGGPENLLSSLIATFMGMEQKLAIKAEPAGRGAALGFARPADLDGVRRNKDCDASIGVFVQPRRTDTHSIPIYTTPSPEPAVEAFGTVNGYRPNARTVEIILDVGVPRWIVGYTPRVTISPTGGKSDA